MTSSNRQSRTRPNPAHTMPAAARPGMARSSKRPKPATPAHHSETPASVYVLNSEHPSVTHSAEASPSAFHRENRMPAKARKNGKGKKRC